MIIDAHHHLWNYRRSEYGWISSGMEVLQRDFLAEDLCREMQSAGVDGAVVVQARQSLAETKWLLACAAENPCIRGVVGWAPLAKGDISVTLDEFAGAQKLKGLRHVMQDEACGFMLRDDFNAGISSLLGTELVYDILIQERQLREAVEFVHRHEGQVFVLDHMAKPKIRVGEMEQWRKDLFALAASGEVYCKISGMATEADWNDWTLDCLRPYLDTALEAFGPERLMAGSDWPVCLLASGYKRWWDAVRQWLEKLSATERGSILGGTAARVYQLD